MWQMINLVPHYRTVYKHLICSHLLPFHQRVLQASSAGRQLVLKFWSRGPPLFSSCRLCFCWTSGTNRTQTETQQAVETDTNLQTVYFLLVVTVVFSFSGDSQPAEPGVPRTCWSSSLCSCTPGRSTTARSCWTRGSPAHRTRRRNQLIWGSVRTKRSDSQNCCAPLSPFTLLL